MKNIALLIAVIITFGFASCGEKKKRKRKKGPTLCDCVNEKNPSDECKKMEIEWSEKIKDAGTDAVKLQAVIEDMEAEEEDCMQRYQKGSDKRKEVKREEVMREEKSIDVIDATLAPFEVDPAAEEVKVDEYDPAAML
jgi:hypothetical protein